MKAEKVRVKIALGNSTISRNSLVEGDEGFMCPSGKLFVVFMKCQNIETMHEVQKPNWQM